MTRRRWTRFTCRFISRPVPTRAKAKSPRSDHPVVSRLPCSSPDCQLRERGCVPMLAKSACQSSSLSKEALYHHPPPALRFRRCSQYAQVLLPRFCSCCRSHTKYDTYDTFHALCLLYAPCFCSWLHDLLDDPTAGCPVYFTPPHYSLFTWSPCFSLLTTVSKDNNKHIHFCSTSTLCVISRLRLLRGSRD